MAARSNDGLIRGLRRIATDMALRPGQALFRQDDRADALYLLEHGLLEISTLAADGRKLSLNLLKPGAIFGEVALLEDGSRSATAMALRPSRVLRVGREALLAALRHDPDLALELIRLTVTRFNWVSRQLENHALQPLGVRLARRVVWLLQELGSDDVLTMGQAELADHVGATREAVSKTLKDWKAQGIIEIGRGRILFRDRARLERIAAGDVPQGH
ncbi:Crp/Fnr family transcriptional regulator [Halovulum dunhuangense]|uniref:Crp/Fnr family transcriptional regulator n=1 Tax=Halovulum dunhuangense TaxID=1505036 RepID=A0A849L0Y3_9RHOB|nr:Crp/Fnr family transcriptional regulator [Halovulum dunhuangense]NNU79920.1 Crp/Fnr family transcriptional regulator [Halovulum dunhuangense]